MKKYRFVYNNGYTQDVEFKCDADAMMQARENLKVMLKKAEDYRVNVWCKNDDGITWRHVVTYC